MRSRRTSISTVFNGTIANEREVLTIYLNHLGVGERQVVRSLTHRGIDGGIDEERTLSHVRQDLTDLCEETLADFLTKNRERYPVDPDLNPEGRLICLDEELFKTSDAWHRFHQAFPQSSGIVDFSRVGFDQEVTQAFMYAGNQLGGLAGSGACWLFSKSGGAWVREGVSGLWIS
jgi:hypothetical protein